MRALLEVVPVLRVLTLESQDKTRLLPHRLRASPVIHSRLRRRARLRLAARQAILRQFLRESSVRTLLLSCDLFEPLAKQPVRRIKGFESSVISRLTIRGVFEYSVQF